MRAVGGEWRRWGVGAVWAVFAAGCFGGGVDSGPGEIGTSERIVPVDSGKAECLDITFFERDTEAPAAVSVFFQVQDCDGDPVRDLKDDSFSIYENAELVSRFESQHRVFCKAQKFRSHAMLLLDLSRSVVGSGGEGLEPLQSAAGGFVDSILLPADSGDGNAHDVDVQRVAVYWFDGSAGIYPLVDFTDDRTTLLEGIASLDASTPRDGSTNLYGAVVRGIETLDAARVRAQRDDEIAITTGALTVFTDGTDQAGRVAFETALAKVRATDNDVFTIGLGSEIDPVVLEQLGKTGSRRVGPDDSPDDALQDIEDAFAEVGELIEARANSYYLLKYCSPKRAGEHMLTIVAAREEDAGQQSVRFNASGFGPGCEIPDGTPLGECAP